eukprot:402107_1
MMSQNDMFTRNINQMIEETRANDIQFIVGIHDRQQTIEGNRLLFAAQSPVFRAMFYNGMYESIQQKVFIEDCTVEAIQSIKKYCYAEKPTLSYTDISDIYYAANKYQIEGLIQQCEETILNIGNTDSFFFICKKFSNYPPSIFECFFQKFISTCPFIINNISDILNDKNILRFNKLTIFQVQSLLKFGPFKNEYEKYEIAKNYCKYSRLATKNTNNWRISLNTLFFRSKCVDLTQVSRWDLLKNIKEFSKIVPENELLKVININGLCNLKDIPGKIYEATELRVGCVIDVDCTWIPDENIGWVPCKIINISDVTDEATLEICVANLDDGSNLLKKKLKIDETKHEFVNFRILTSDRWRINKHYFNNFFS